MHSPRQGPDAGTCEHGSKPPAFVNSAGFLNTLSDQYVLKNTYVHGVTYSAMKLTIIRVRHDNPITLRTNLYPWKCHNVVP
jgi:hypothetical protein